MAQSITKCPTTGSAHPGSCEGGKSAGPGSTAGCSTPSAAPDRPGYDSVCAWPETTTHINIPLTPLAR